MERDEWMLTELDESEGGRRVEGGRKEKGKKRDTDLDDIPEEAVGGGVGLLNLRPLACQAQLCALEHQVGQLARRGGGRGEEREGKKT